MELDTSPENEPVENELIDDNFIDDYKDDFKSDESGPIIIVTSLFFIWGFLTVMNNLLMPKLQAVFQLDTSHTKLLSYAFFAGYFLLGLIYFILAKFKIDPINVFGYKKTIIIGLLFSATGCALFYPAAENLNYETFLIALFVLASGFAILQIVANPYVTLLGPESTASSRLNMSQAFNSLGTTLAPYVGSILILDMHSGQSNSAEAVETPYLILAGVLIILAILIHFAYLPEIKAEPAERKNAFEYKHLNLAVLAIFMYVGGEVSIGSNIQSLISEDITLNISESQMSGYLSLYWGGAMIGRFMGAIFMSRIPKRAKNGIGFFFILGSFVLAFLLTSNFTTALIFTFIGLLNYLAFVFTSQLPQKIVGTFAGIVLILLTISMVMTGYITLWSLIAIGIFNSIMFNNIFTLGLKKLKSLTSRGSALLVLAISGGGVIPFLQGELADVLGVQNSFLVPLACYFYIMVFGFFWSQPSKVKPTA